MAKLVLSSGGTVVNNYFIEKPRVAIGRAAASDVLIDDPAVSRDHAAIITVGDDQIVEDLGSRLGTFVNGQRVSRQILKHRDVIELGAFQLCYLNSRLADADFERTMLIAALPRKPSGEGETAPVTPARVAKVRFPGGSVRWLGGPRAGTQQSLDRVVATFGKPGEQLAVITRRPQGFYLTHVEGPRLPAVNGEAVGREPRLLKDGDVLDLADEKLEFRLAPPQQGVEGHQQ